jgi:hypothetical protein
VSDDVRRRSVFLRWICTLIAFDAFYDGGYGDCYVSAHAFHISLSRCLCTAFYNQIRYSYSMSMRLPFIELEYQCRDTTSSLMCYLMCLNAGHSGRTQHYNKSLSRIYQHNEWSNSFRIDSRNSYMYHPSRSTRLVIANLWAVRTWCAEHYTSYHADHNTPSNSLSLKKRFPGNKMSDAWPAIPFCLLDTRVPAMFAGCHLDWQYGVDRIYCSAIH